MPDGSLLFTEQDAGNGRLVKIDKTGSISTFLDNTNRTIGLAWDAKGQLIGTQSKIPRVGILHPTQLTLAEEFDGVPLVAPNDLVVDRKGGIYFSDPLGSRFRPDPPGRTRPLLFYIRPDGRLIKISDELDRPNGITLSPDETVLYASNGRSIAAFDVQPDGSVRNLRTFATLVGGGNADSMCIDAAGRVYVAAGSGLAPGAAETGGGVQVFSPQGLHLGTIPTPLPAYAAAFAGPDKKTLYVVGGGAVYRVAMIAQGIQVRAK